MCRCMLTMLTNGEWGRWGPCRGRPAGVPQRRSAAVGAASRSVVVTSQEGERGGSRVMRTGQEARGLV